MQETGAHRVSIATPSEEGFSLGLRNHHAFKILSACHGRVLGGWVMAAPPSYCNAGRRSVEQNLHEMLCMRTRKQTCAVRRAPCPAWCAYYSMSDSTRGLREAFGCEGAHTLRDLCCRIVPHGVSHNLSEEDEHFHLGRGRRAGVRNISVSPHARRVHPVRRTD